MSEVVEESVAEPEQTAPDQEVTAAPVVEDKPVKSFSQDEVDAIVTRRLAKEQRKLTRQAELEAENRVLRDQVNKRTVAPEPTAPKQDDFGTFEEYLEAKAEWIAEKRVEAKLTEREQKQEQRKLEGERETVVKSWQQKVDAAVTKYADYGDALESVDHIEIPEQLQVAIMESDLGADLAYHLAKNPSELERITSLKPHAALMALGKIEDKLSQAPAEVKKPVSKAPAPIKPLGGKSDASPGHSPADDMATFIRKRNLEKGRIK
jgi:hypothetical protein